MEIENHDMRPVSEKEKPAIEGKVSRRQWMQSAANVTMAATVISSVVGSETPSYSAQSKPSEKSFDIHQHLAPLIDNNFSEIGSVDQQIEKDYEARVRIMDDNGIEQASINAATVRYRKTEGIENTKKLNDFVAAYVAKHSDRFPVGAGTVEPSHGDASLRELERMAKELRLRGVIWHHTFSGVPIDDPFMRPILKKVSELQLIPFIHITEPPMESVYMLEILAGEFPNITFVALNGISSLAQQELSLLLAKRQKNILFDTGPSVSGDDLIRRFVKEVGADRLAYGSSLYAVREPWHRSVSLEAVRSASITAEERAKILAGNARKLFRL